MDRDLITLEYDKVISLVKEYAYSSSGKRRLDSCAPVRDIASAERLLEETAQADRLLYEKCVTLSFAFDDIGEILEGANRGRTLSPSELLKTARVLKVGRNAKSCILGVGDSSFGLLKEYCQEIFTDVELENDVFTSIIGENELADEASAELGRIRRSIKACNDKIRQKLNSYVASAGYSKYLQDNIVTMRDNRYVIPLKCEYNGKIEGLIHDRSASGATLFIEPIAVVEANNELRTLQLEEKEEIVRILAAFSAKVAAEAYGISVTFETVSQLDAIFAKAAYARVIKAKRPILNAEGVSNIKDGRHPLIPPQKVVPVSLSLGKNYNTLVISGPNTGGKTVTLKLVGLLAAMAASGLFIPTAEESEIALYNGIFCDIGDEQSIEQNLSTFSSHVINLIRITENVGVASLVLLDEPGGGTDPEEGGALAVGVLEYLRNNGCKTICTSHYGELKEYSYVTDGVRGAGMDFDPVTFSPTYRLVDGLAGSSNALEIAGMLGLNSSIISTARARFSQEKLAFDKVVAGAERARRDAEELLEQAKNERRSADTALNEASELARKNAELNVRLNEKLRKSAREVLGGVAEEAEELLDELNEKVKQCDEKALFEARKLNKRIHDLTPKYEAAPTEKPKRVDGELMAGDSVFVKSLNCKATVCSVVKRKGEVVVKAGSFTTSVKLSDVYRVEGVESRGVANVVAHLSSDACPMEINLIGQHVDEALYNADAYLARAQLQGYHEVRIIHGVGSGALRGALREMCRTHPSVETYRTGGLGEGGDGATVVTLK